MLNLDKFYVVELIIVIITWITFISWYDTAIAYINLFFTYDTPFHKFIVSCSLLLGLLLFCKIVMSYTKKINPLKVLIDV